MIVFASGAPHGLWEVPARGGTPRLLISPTEIDPSTGQPIGAVYWAHFLPLAGSQCPSARKVLAVNGSDPARCTEGEVCNPAWPERSCYRDLKGAFRSASAYGFSIGSGAMKCGVCRAAAGVAIGKRVVIEACG